MKTSKDTQNLFRVVNKRIKFGILVKLDITNHHSTQSFDRLKNYCTKLDVFTYLSPFINREDYDYNDDFIDDNINSFKDDALWVRNMDSQNTSTFFLVCYLTNKNGDIQDMAIIKQLFFEQ